MIRGTTPPGAHTEEQASRWVRTMFDRVTPRYDLVNHVISFQLDRWWRARTARRVRSILDRPDARVLDLCCGSGDLLLALATRARATVLGSDFSHAMLLEATRKSASQRRRCPLFEADALRLPIAGSSIDLVTAAFGFRNLANYRAGLEELLRILKPGAAAAILEFSTPPNRAFRALYGFYFHRILPRIAGMISGSPDAYSYLSKSVSNFPDADSFAEEMRAAGFHQVTYEHMTFGVVALHIGHR